MVMIGATMLNFQTFQQQAILSPCSIVLTLLKQYNVGTKVISIYVLLIINNNRLSLEIRYTKLNHKKWRTTRDEIFSSSIKHIEKSPQKQNNVVFIQSSWAWEPLKYQYFIR